jgi:carbonic anhydrase
MLKRTLLASAVIGLALATPAIAQETVEWSYEGATGPEHWASLSPAFAACGEGSRRSPIDLVDPTRQPAPAILTDYASSVLTERNNGETVEVRSELDQQLVVGGKAYRLAQFHFHVPSEHVIAGARR